MLSADGSRSRRLLLVRLGISVVLVWLVLRWVDWRQVALAWADVDPLPLVGSASLLLFSNVLGAIQWHLLLRACGVHVPASSSMRAYFVGLFFNNFLPSGMGGDAVKVWDVGWKEGKTGETVAATVADRFIGMCVLTALAVVTLFCLPEAASLRRSALLSLGVFSLLLVLVALVLLPAAEVPLRRGIARLPGRIAAPTDALYARGRALSGRPLFLLGLVALSAVIQGSRVFVHAWTGAALGIDLPLGVYLTIVPVLGVLVMLPSINGIGIREGGGVLLFGEAGLDATSAVSMQLLTYVVMVALSLIGGVFFALGRRSDGPSPEEGAVDAE